VWEKRKDKLCTILVDSALFVSCFLWNCTMVQLNAARPVVHAAPCLRFRAVVFCFACACEVVTRCVCWVRSETRSTVTIFVRFNPFFFNRFTAYMFGFCSLRLSISEVSWNNFFS
jgi:apolipoprotein N-acyltransferase